MKLLFKYSLIPIALFLLSFKTYSSDTVAVRYVVIIGVDGLSAWSIEKHDTPVLDSLMRTGAYSLHAKAVYPTLSSPNWASMIMGVRPKDHGIKSNHWTSSDRDGKNSLTIFKLIKDQRPGLTMAIFHHWKEFADLLEQDCISMTRYLPNENALINLAAENIKNSKTRFTFIHLDHVDSSGHHFGHRSKEYQKAVMKTDSLVGAFIKQINNSDLKGKITLIITSDHGFWGKHHGSFSKKEKNIPWIICGPDIRASWRLRKKVRTFDTAATLAYLFSIQLPGFWEGKVVREAFVK